MLISGGCGRKNGAGMQIDIKEMAKLTGLHTKTLQRWDRDGKLSSIGRSETGRRVYDMEQVAEAKLLAGRSIGDLSGLIRTEHRMVDPVDLGIDNEWECDPANLSFLEYSMRKSGFTQSIYAWVPEGDPTAKPRAIDGLHRTVTARKLGIPAIPADIFVGSEEDFWSHRINSALKHHVVKRERLGAFIAECWQSSGMYDPITVERMQKDFRRFGYKMAAQISDDDLRKYSAARAVWEIDFSTHRLGSDNVERRRAVDPEARAWFVEKAAMWGISEADIKSRILEALGFPVPASSNARQISAALYRNAAIEFGDQVAIIEQVKKAPSADPVTVEKWVAETIAAGDPDEETIEGEARAETERVTLAQYLKNAQDAERSRLEEIRARQAEKKKKDDQPADTRRTDTQRIDTFRRQVRSVSSSIAGLKIYLKSPSKDYASEVAPILEATREILRMIPGWETESADDLKVEVISLRSENERIKLELESLRARSVPVPASVVALSSSQIREN